jgi:hypothetical protein
MMKLVPGWPSWAASGLAVRFRIRLSKNDDLSSTRPYGLRSPRDYYISQKGGTFKRGFRKKMKKVVGALRIFSEPVAIQRL